MHHRKIVIFLNTDITGVTRETTRTLNVPAIGVAVSAEAASVVDANVIIFEGVCKLLSGLITLRFCIDHSLARWG